MPLFKVKPLKQFGGSQISTFERARRYIAKIPPAVSGQGGHAQTFHVACLLVHGFGLSEADALVLLSEWSKTCLPPWNDAELRHKIQSASNANHNKPRGHLTAGSYNSTPSPIDADGKRKADNELRQRTLLGWRTIRDKYRCTIDDLTKSSPVRLDEEAVGGIITSWEDWLLLLPLFNRDEAIWIGEENGQGSEWNCLTPQGWIEFNNRRPAQVYWPFICPNPLKQGATLPCAENIKETRHLVVSASPSTTVNLCTLFAWLKTFLRLRAIVDSGSELQAWFDYPNAATLSELRIMLPALGCDPAIFNPWHMCRLPGPMRDTGRRQRLIYLDLPEGAL